MVFHRAKIKNDQQSNIVMNNVCLQRTNNLKYLGVVIDHKLNWTHHIAYVKNKISKGIGIMYRARNCLTKNSLRKLHFAYIYPYLIYCIEIWGISPQTHLKPLLLLQKKLVRIMTFSTYYAHTDPLFKDMEILIIDRLVIHRIGILMYKLNSGHLPKVLCNFFKKNNEIHNYNTRTKDMFRISHESQTFSSVGAKIWNALSIKIDVNVTLIKFKNSLKVYLLSNSLVINYPK